MFRVYGLGFGVHGLGLRAFRVEGFGFGFRVTPWRVWSGLLLGAGGLFWSDRELYLAYVARRLRSRFWGLGLGFRVRV